MMDAHVSSVACVHAGNKQRSLPPRNCTPAAKGSALSVFVADQWCDCSDIGQGVRWKRLPCCEVMFIPRRTRVVGRKEACRSEAVVHLPEIRSARKYVVARIKGVEAEAVANAEFNQVPGMSCIRPIAPRGEIACSSPPLSIWMTARIQRAGTAKRSEASSIIFASRSVDSARDRFCADAGDAQRNKAAVGIKNSVTAAKMRAIGESEPNRLDAWSGASA